VRRAARPEIDTVSDYRGAVMASPRSDQLVRLQAVTDVALAHLELDELLAELLQRITAMLETDTCAILLHDEESHELVARAAVGIEEEVEQGVRIPVGRGFAGRIAAERRAVVLPDVDHADVLNPILREKGIKSLLGVPLVAHGELMGVLHVGSLVPRDFTSDDVALLQLVGDRVAVGLERSRLYAAERAARVRLERLQAVTDVALAHLDLEELLDELLQRITAILATDTCAILLLDEATNELVARAAVGIEEEVEQGVRIPVGGGFAGRVAAERRAIVLPDVDHAHVLNPILREKGIKSLLGVPLVAHDDVVGVLHVGSLTPRDFTPDDVDLLQLVADRVAVAIERARLHRAARELDDMKLNFVAVASHELRTPATAVYGALETLRARPDLPPEVRAELEESAWSQSVRLRRLVEQLLDLSRLDAARLRVAKQPLQLRPLLDEVAAAAGGGVEVDAADVALSGDPLVLERVLSNLVLNAKSYGRPPIRLGGERRNGAVRITVEDSGPGVPEELVPQLFERFARGEEGTGSGLGLAIAKAYATAHGGELSYCRGDSGARFELVLPQE
jgi:signal transduction histidine kinase